MFIGRVGAVRVVYMLVYCRAPERMLVSSMQGRDGCWVVFVVWRLPMRLDGRHAFSSGGLCYGQGERCKVSTVKKWTPSTRNSGAQPYFSGPTLVRPRVKTKRPHALD